MADADLIALLRRRTTAGWIDVLLLATAGVLISFAGGQSHVGSWTSSDGAYHTGVQINLAGWAFLVWALASLLYYFSFEFLTEQSVGKMVMGLRVITLSGQPLGVRAVFLRTLGRIIDVLPAFYLVGWILMRGPYKPPQRLGDRWAQTTVVPVSHP